MAVCKREKIMIQICIGPGKAIQGMAFQAIL